MNEDILKITHEDLLRDPDLIDRVQRDALRYRALEMGRILRTAHDSVQNALSGAQPSTTAGLRTACCGQPVFRRMAAPGKEPPCSKTAC